MRSSGSSQGDGIRDPKKVLERPLPTQKKAEQAEILVPGTPSPVKTKVLLTSRFFGSSRSSTKEKESSQIPSLSTKRSSLVSSTSVVRNLSEQFVQIDVNTEVDEFGENGSQIPDSPEQKHLVRQKNSEITPRRERASTSDYFERTCMLTTSTSYNFPATFCSPLVRSGRMSLRASSTTPPASVPASSVPLNMSDDEAEEKENDKFVVNQICDSDEDRPDYFPTSEREIKKPTRPRLLEKYSYREKATSIKASYSTQSISTKSDDGSLEEYERIDSGFTLFSVFEKKTTSRDTTIERRLTIPDSPTKATKRKRSTPNADKLTRQFQDYPRRVLDSPERPAIYSDSEEEDSSLKRRKLDERRSCPFVIPNSPCGSDKSEEDLCLTENLSSEPRSLPSEGNTNGEKPALGKSSSFSRLFSFKPNYIAGGPRSGSPQRINKL